MESPWIKTLIVIFWFASMTWLALVKLFPVIQSGTPPEGIVAILQADDEPIHECWKIIWKDRPIGWSETIAERHADATSSVNSHVHFDRLPISAMLRDGLGPLKFLFGSAASTGRDLDISMDVTSTLKTDVDGRLDRFDSTIDLSDVGSLCHLTGILEGDQLNVVVTAGEALYLSGLGSSQELYRGSLDFPETESLADGFAPQSRLAKLYVGQQWTFPSVRPFPPNSPLQIVEARVEEEKVVVWEHDLVTVLVVTFREAAGAGLTRSRTSFGEMWVRRDGTVLRQSLTIAGLTVDFQRQSWPRSSGVPIHDSN